MESAKVQLTITTQYAAGMMLELDSLLAVPRRRAEVSVRSFGASCPLDELVHGLQRCIIKTVRWNPTEFTGSRCASNCERSFLEVLLVDARQASMCLDVKAWSQICHGCSIAQVYGGYESAFRPDTPLPLTRLATTSQ